MSQLLPEAVRAALRRASLIKDDRERLRAIERLIERARNQYPERFNPERRPCKPD